MTYEEMQKTMQFILEVQAQSTVKLDALTEAQKRAEQRQDRAEQVWARTEESIRSLLSIAEIHEREITALSESLKENAASLSKNISSLGESGRATDERLNALVVVVERMISEGRNGK